MPYNSSSCHPDPHGTLQPALVIPTHRARSSPRSSSQPARRAPVRACHPDPQGALQPALVIPTRTARSSPRSSSQPAGRAPARARHPNPHGTLQPALVIPTHRARSCAACGGGICFFACVPILAFCLPVDGGTLNSIDVSPRKCGQSVFPKVGGQQRPEIGFGVSQPQTKPCGKNSDTVLLRFAPTYQLMRRRFSPPLLRIPPRPHHRVSSPPATPFPSTTYITP